MVCGELNGSLVQCDGAVQQVLDSEPLALKLHCDVHIQTAMHSINSLYSISTVNSLLV